MAQIIDFPLRQPKISILPRVFTIFYEMYREKQNEILKKKLQFLHEQAFSYYYDMEEEYIPKSSEVDFPKFVYEEQRKQRAYDKASKVILEIAQDNDRINKCYSRRCKELRQKGIRVKL